MEDNRYKIIRLMIICITVYLTVSTVAVMTYPDSPMRLYYSISNIINSLIYGSPTCAAPC